MVNTKHVKNSGYISLSFRGEILTGIKFLTFDCYGTLIDWKSGIESNFTKFFLKSSVEKAKVGNIIFEKYVSLEASEESNYKPYTQVLEETALKLALSFGLESFDGEAPKRFAASIKEWIPFPDKRQTLSEMGSRGLKRIILSNIDKDLLKDTLRNGRIEVDGFITAQDVGSYKPEKNHWISFFEKFGAKREETLHVAGSIYHDIIPANELGLKTVWVNRYQEKKPANVNSTYTIRGLADLLGILDSLK